MPTSIDIVGGKVDAVSKKTDDLKDDLKTVSNVGGTVDAISKGTDDLKDDVKTVGNNVTQLLFHLMETKKVIFARVFGVPTLLDSKAVLVQDLETLLSRSMGPTLTLANCLYYIC